MSSIQLKVLISKVQDDVALQNQINNAQSPEKVLAIAKEHGNDRLALLAHGSGGNHCEVTIICRFRMDGLLKQL